MEHTLAKVEYQGYMRTLFRRELVEECRVPPGRRLRNPPVEPARAFKKKNVRIQVGIRNNEYKDHLLVFVKFSVKMNRFNPYIASMIPCQCVLVVLVVSCCRALGVRDNASSHHLKV
ncbi:hypothetical protein BDV40DRAFT_148936 [Aspergillus tamarii]|uniref:Uncharacterized protein n=1 Tax=Aspergillus tamarii TaxID=41984 RepID=A0A5N6UWF2_ASPTM|nr:hypothetical protein BDV40DRAFT_148936 [Aspergillus tamarii]